MSDQPAEPGYAAAVAELEAILAELEADDIDVDLLASKVARAADLIDLCRLRIDAARDEVDRAVGRLRLDDDGGAAR